MSAKTSLLLSNFIDVDHQNSGLFTNKGHLYHLHVLIGVLAKCHELYFTNSSSLTLEQISAINSV